MKRLLNNITETLADAALLEMGVDVTTTEERAAAESKEGVLARFFRSATDTLADAAMLEEGIDIFSNYRKAEAELKEHRSDRDSVPPDECRHGDNEMCFRHAA